MHTGEGVTVLASDFDNKIRFVLLRLLATAAIDKKSIAQRRFYGEATAEFASLFHIRFLIGISYQLP